MDYGVFTTFGARCYANFNLTILDTCPVTIGDDVWLGGSSVILPGVTIGDGAVIGAGCVVTRDIPPMVVAAGNPSRVIREITEADRRKLFRREDIDDEIWEMLQRGE